MSDVQENISELFFSKLKLSPNPGVVLAQFYSSVMGLEVGRSEIMMFNKLIKMFGRTSVFFSVMDISKIDTPTEFPYGLLHHICRTKLEKSMEADMAMTSMFSLERKITELRKDIDSIKKIDPAKAEKYLEGKE